MIDQETLREDYEGLYQSIKEGYFDSIREFFFGSKDPMKFDDYMQGFARFIQEKAVIAVRMV